MSKLPTKNKKDFESVRERLKVEHLRSINLFSSKFPKAYELIGKKKLDVAKLRDRSSKIISAGALTGSLLLTPAKGVELPMPSEIVEKIKTSGEKLESDSSKKILIDSLNRILPSKVRPLSYDEEKYLEQVIAGITGIPSKATLEGEHLNTSYGLIGAEQHLRRYPGDVLENHGSGDDIKEGIAPGLGAWGYFAPSKEKLTRDLVETEQWYAVVQTLYLPDWNTRTRYLRDWYKYRKVIIVNTLNGNTVVAAVADSGPAAWTGKSFGGSPEVMDYLGGPRYKKGPVIIFFVDDPENKIPLGPIEYNKIKLPEPVVEKA